VVEEGPALLLSDDVNGAIRILGVLGAGDHIGTYLRDSLPNGVRVVKTPDELSVLLPRLLREAELGTNTEAATTLVRPKFKTTRD
jgi:hypothetical protein